MGKEIVKSFNYNTNISSFHIIVAGKKIEIMHQYRTVYDQCKDYISDFDIPDFVIPYSPVFSAAISKKIDKPVFDINLENVAITLDPAALESLCIYFLIAHKMLEDDTLLVHGAIISLFNKGYVFIGPSGIGKTTHVLNWLKIFPEAIIVNGDKPLINTSKKLVYGTPWCGKEGFNINTSVPLNGIIALERGKVNHLEPITFHEMLPFLLQQTYIPNERELAIKVYSLIGNLKEIPCYKLICNMDEESARVAYNGIKSKETLI